MKLFRVALGVLALTPLVLAVTSALAQNAPPAGSPAATAPINPRRIPNPPGNFGGTINLDARNSTPYWQPQIAPPKGAPERPPGPDRRRRIRRAEHVRRRHSHAAPGQDRQHGPALHAVPHHVALLADPRRPHHRPQPSLGRLRRHQRSLDRLSRLRQRHHQGQGHRRPHPECQRLRHVVVRQEPQHAVVRDQPGRPLRPVAQRHGLRILLRLQQRRDQPVAA